MCFATLLLSRILPSIYIYYELLLVAIKQFLTLLQFDVNQKQQNLLAIDAACSLLKERGHAKIFSIKWIILFIV